MEHVNHISVLAACILNRYWSLEVKIKAMTHKANQQRPADYHFFSKNEDGKGAENKNFKCHSISTFTY